MAARWRARSSRGCGGLSWVIERSRSAMSGQARRASLQASPLSSSVSTTRSRPASFSPSSRLMSVTPLRRPAHLADRLDLGADQHAAGRDEHHFIVRMHERRRHHLAVALVLLDRDHAFGAAAVSRVFDDRRALAVAVLGRGQHRLRLVFGHQHRDHALLLVEHHPAHAVRIAAHRPHVVLVEAHRLAARAEQHHVVRAVGQRDADQRIAVVQVDRDDAGRPRPREFGQRRLLHGADTPWP